VDFIKLIHFLFSLRDRPTTALPNPIAQRWVLDLVVSGFVCFAFAFLRKVVLNWTAPTRTIVEESEKVVAVLSVSCLVFSIQASRFFSFRFDRRFGRLGV
jgi:hypothetical protein